MVLHKKNEFEGKDVADAISKACKSLNASQEQLDIEVLSTGTSGIFGLCSKKARLRVTLKDEFAEKGFRNLNLMGIFLFFLFRKLAQNDTREYINQLEKQTKGDEK